jgi:hypothetical protein
LIKQSYADIAALRRIHTIPSPTTPLPVYTPKTKSKGIFKEKSTPDLNSTGSPKEKQLQQVLVDFDKLENNLRKFEVLYNGFLKKEGGEGEEVHLVAVVCEFAFFFFGSLLFGGVIFLSEMRGRVTDRW